MHRHRDYRPDDETGGLLRTARVSVRAGRMLGAGLDPVALGPSGRLVLEVHLVDVDVGDLGRRDVLLGEDRVDGARIDACTSIDALRRSDENHPVIVGLVDAVHGADLDAGLVLQVDASLSDDVGHAGWSLAKAEALSSIARGEGPLPGTGTGGPWGCSRVPTRSDERHRALPARSEGVDEPPPELHRHRAAVGHGPVGAPADIGFANESEPGGIAAENSLQESAEGEAAAADDLPQFAVLEFLRAGPGEDLPLGDGGHIEPQTVRRDGNHMV